MKHFLKIKEAESFLDKLKDGTRKRKYRFDVKGSPSSLKQFKLDILSKANKQGFIGKDGKLAFYSFTGMPSKDAVGTIIRLSSGKWILDTSDQDRLASISLHPDVAKAAGQEFARMLLGTITPDEDIFGEDTEDEEEDDFIEDEFTSDDESDESNSSDDLF